LLGGPGNRVIELTGQAYAQKRGFPRLGERGAPSTADDSDSFLCSRLSVGVVDDAALAVA
jgi:hypothetical protein